MYPMIALLALGVARAADTPTLWTRVSAAATWHPVGVLIDGTAEVHAPVLRLGSPAFQNTFVGAGARVAVSPAYIDVAARVSVQPIDLLPITIEAVHTSYWESPWGLVPADTITNQRGRDRLALYQADRDFAGSASALIVSPTLQVRLGAFAAFTNPVLTWIRVRPEQGPEPWVYEPFRGQVIGYRDRLVEHTSAILWEAEDGEDGPLFRIGPALRGRSSAVTGDRFLQLGGVAQWRPGREPAAPTFLLLVAPYLQDPDFAGPVPFVAGLVTFQREVTLSTTAVSATP